MDVETVAWFGSEFKREEGKKFRDALDKENYDSSSLQIKESKAIKQYIELRKLCHTKFSSLPLIFFPKKFKDFKFSKMLTFSQDGAIEHFRRGDHYFDESFLERKRS